MTLFGLQLVENTWLRSATIDTEGLALLDAAIAKGYGPAMYEKARMVNLTMPQLGPPEESVRLSEAAVAAGWPEGKLLLMMDYRHGFGVPQDQARSAALWKEWSEEVSPMLAGLEYAYSTWPPRP